MFDRRDLLIYLAIKYDGNYQKIINAIRANEDPSIPEIEEAVSTVKSKTITILDVDYPDYLRKGRYPPIVLFYYGDISLINKENFEKNIAVIGSRVPTHYGIRATEIMVAGITPGHNIVSGLAKGIDGIAQRTALDKGAKVIAVLGSGIDNVYPLENKKLYHDIINNGGLIISEYPNLSEPAGHHFPIRDRIIAQISRSVLVTEAYEMSGTSITVGFAVQIGRDIFAVPYPFFVKSSFCNQLIYEGALMVREPNDILEVIDKY